MDWRIERLGNTVHIHGPDVKLEIDSFDQRKVRVDDKSVDSDRLFEDWRERTWNYELSPGVGLLLQMVRDAANPGGEKSWLVIYAMQWRVTWDVPDEFAEELYALREGV
jgi:hypothetical protein